MKVAIAGLKGSGKDLCGEIISRLLTYFLTEEKRKVPSFDELMKFGMTTSIRQMSDYLKESISSLFGIKEQLFNSRSSKEGIVMYDMCTHELIPYDENKLVSENELIECIESLTPPRYMSLRQLLQYFADIAKRLFGEDVFIDRIIDPSCSFKRNCSCNACPINKSCFSSQYLYSGPGCGCCEIITGIRFPNEINKLKDNDYKIIRIDRDSSIEGIHNSERELLLIPDEKFDLIIKNNSSKDDLVKDLFDFIIDISNDYIKTRLSKSMSKKIYVNNNDWLDFRVNGVAIDNGNF